MNYHFSGLPLLQKWTKWLRLERKKHKTTGVLVHYWFNLQQWRETTDNVTKTNIPVHAMKATWDYTAEFASWESAYICPICFGKRVEWMHEQWSLSPGPWEGSPIIARLLCFFASTAQPFLDHCNTQAAEQVTQYWNMTEPGRKTLHTIIIISIFSFFDVKKVNLRYSSSLVSFSSSWMQIFIDHVHHAW